jgi:cellulose synthase operon protein YhjQ
VLAIDLDPANMLAQQLGADAAPQLGIANSDDWTRTALVNSEGLRFVPFGMPALPALLRFERQLVEHAGWLQERLREAALAEDTVVLVDTPRLPSLLALHAAAAADLVLTAVHAEPVAYAALDRLPRLARARMHYVVNAFEPQRPLQQDVLLLLRERLGQRLLRTVLHRDAAVGDALARNRALLEDAPYSQAAEDLQHLCNWLSAAVDGVRG